MFYQFNHLSSPDYLKIERGINFSFPPHLHQCFELILLLSGEMRVTVDGEAFTVRKGEGMMIFPDQIHSLESERSEHVLCIFSLRLTQAYAAKTAGKLPQSGLFVPDPYLVQALDRMEPDASAVERKGVLYSLCAAFDRTAVYRPGHSDNEKLLNRIFSFVGAEFAEDCSLTALSRATGYDYSYLSRFFKKAVGISFNCYVDHYRLSHACYLLENTAAPVLQCAMESGYTSLRSFNRNFKSYYRITPTQYRKQVKR